MPANERPIPVHQLLLRASSAESAAREPAVGNLVRTLVERITNVLDKLAEPSLPVYVDAFMALATAIEVAEVLSRRPEA